MNEDFDAFLAAALAEGEMPISAGGPPLRALFPPPSSPESITAEVAEGTIPVSAGFPPKGEDLVSGPASVTKPKKDCGEPVQDGDSENGALLPKTKPHFDGA